MRRRRMKPEVEKAIADAESEGQSRGTRDDTGGDREDAARDVPIDSTAAASKN